MNNKVPIYGDRRGKVLQQTCRPFESGYVSAKPMRHPKMDNYA